MAGSDEYVALLTGGQSTRMGQDKSLMPIMGRPLLLEHLDMWQGRAKVLLLSNTNKIPQLIKFQPELCLANVQALQDAKPDDFAGPLSGLLSAMRFAAQHSKCNYIFVQPCDVFGLNLALYDALLERFKSQQYDICSIKITGRYQPLFAIISLSLLSGLERYFAQGGRSVMKWFAGHRILWLDEIDLSALGVSLDKFYPNLNTFDDVEAIEISQ